MTNGEKIELAAVVVVVYLIAKQWWRAHCKKMDRDNLVHQAAVNAGAAAAVKYAADHPVQMRAAVYDDGTAEDAKAYWMGRESAEKAAFAEAMAHPDVAIAMMRRHEREIERIFGPFQGTKDPEKS